MSTLLNTRQRKFAKFYAQGMKSVDAALAAGYSTSNTQEVAQRLLARENILIYVNFLRQSRKPGVSLSSDDLLSKVKHICLLDYNDATKLDLIRQTLGVHKI